jgi:cysteinyl-tRNA synthetase
MALKVYNYLTRELERFRPINRDRVNMYVCGPTVYDHSHLGHAKTYVSMDIVVRYLRYTGYHVTYVRNLTDVGHLLRTGEDRIMRGARREGLQPMEVVDTYIRSFHDDMDAIGVVRPNISPRATCHVPEMIEWVRDLIDQGHAYEANGNVYFSIESFPEYGRLSHREVEDLQAGARVAVREEKKNPADFALWKRAEPEHIMRWPSPWGEGYPGWHIECSVMSNKYLGETFDIHGGGLENMFPHNDCEIAQSEAHNDSQFANYWLLVGSLTVNGVQMSKSLGNFLTIKDALKLYSAEAIRYFVLTSHYRGSVDYSREALQSAQRGIRRFHNTVRKLRRRMKDLAPTSGAGTAALSSVMSLEGYRDDFRAAMDDDFNTPQALSVIFELVKEVNRTLEQKQDASLGTLSAMDKIFRDLAGDVLGILPENLDARVGGDMVEGLVNTLLDIRDEYREERAWDKADAIRDRLSELGIAIEDGQDETMWSLKS